MQKNKQIIKIYIYIILNMPLLKMQFQTKNQSSLSNLSQIQQYYQNQQLIQQQQINQYKFSATKKNAPLLSGLVSRIQNLPKGGCRSCGR